MSPCLTASRWSLREVGSENCLHIAKDRGCFWGTFYNIKFTIFFQNVDGATWWGTRELLHNVLLIAVPYLRSLIWFKAFWGQKGSSLLSCTLDSCLELLPKFISLLPLHSLCANVSLTSKIYFNWKFWPHSSNASTCKWVSPIEIFWSIIWSIKQSFTLPCIEKKYFQSAYQFIYQVQKWNLPYSSINANQGT